MYNIGSYVENMMSGGTFDYKQCNIRMMAEELNEIVSRCKSKDDDNSFYTSLSEETINTMEYTITLLHLAYIHVNRIDYLISCDDNESSFRTQLNDDLECEGFSYTPELKLK